MPKYTLIVSSGTTDFYLADRFSIKVEEESDFESFATQDSQQQMCGGACMLANRSRTWKFKLHFVGNCSLATAWALFNAFNDFLTDACEAKNEIIIRRRVQDEDFLTYRITNYTLNMIDIINQYVQQRILTMEFIATLTAWPVGGTVVVGP